MGWRCSLRQLLWCGARCAAPTPELRDGSIIFPRAYPRDAVREHAEHGRCDGRGLIGRAATGRNPGRRGRGDRGRRHHGRDRGVGPRGAHPDRDPADADALRPGPSQPARGARVDGRARPPGAGYQAHRRHRQAPSRAGAGGGEGGGQGRARRGPGAGQEGPLARGRGRHPRGRRGEAPPARARRLIGAGRPLECRGIPLIPVNPT